MYPNICAKRSASKAQTKQLKVIIVLCGYYPKQSLRALNRIPYKPKLITMVRQITLALMLCLGETVAVAQDGVRITPGRAGMYPAYVSFAVGAEPDFVPGTVELQQQDAFMPSTATILIHSEPDQLGQIHYRYQQKINNIPVEGAVYIVHVAANKVKSLNGEWIKTIPADLDIVPVISEYEALQNAMTAFGAKSYKWQLAAEEAFIKAESGRQDATFLPNGELVYYSGEEEINGTNLRLAWKLDLYAQDPIGRRIYFVDAENGTILALRELLHTSNTTGTAVTGYSGTQTIITDQTSATSFRLAENTRGNGVYTLNMHKTTTYSAASYFTDADNYWNNVNTELDQYATDAHWGAEMTYDYYKTSFNRNSINNAGYSISSYVHFGTGYFNAFWDGTRMTYGDGNSTDNYKPLTAIDVCGHEITHGLTSFTAALNYNNESGALNEGFSDIFGTTIEFYAKPATANWQMGDAFYTIRSMSAPKVYGQPDTYKGINWAIGTADNGGVHTNSGVLNYWYYLLCIGGSGMNDNAFSYSVSGIGITKAAAIAYRTLTVYLTSTSQYSNARTYTIQAANDLYGVLSNEVTQVTNAWNAVGVAAPAPPPSCADVYEPNESRPAAKSIAVNTDILARIGSSTDNDWFVFNTTSAAPKLKTTLSALPANYDMKLLDATGKQLAVSKKTGTTAESITYNSKSVGATYYVQVYGFNKAYNTSVCYQLRVATSNVNQVADQLIDDSDTASDDSNAFITVNSQLLAGSQLIVFPIPARENINIAFIFAEAGTTTITLNDLVGRVLLYRNVDVRAGSNNVSFSLANYAPGTYFVHVPGKRPAKFQIVE
jgi:Zn-dependent metalloprotease